MLSEEIITLIDNGKPQEAIEKLRKLVTENPQDDNSYYAMGRLYWQLGDHSEAVNCYRRAVEINPDSPARHALELANDVFDFFNPDLLNP